MPPCLLLFSCTTHTVRTLPLPALRAFHACSISPDRDRAPTCLTSFLVCLFYLPDLFRFPHHLPADIFRISSYSGRDCCLCAAHVLMGLCLPVPYIYLSLPPPPYRRYLLQFCMTFSPLLTILQHTSHHLFTCKFPGGDRDPHPILPTKHCLSLHIPTILCQAFSPGKDWFGCLLWPSLKEDFTTCLPLPLPFYAFLPTFPSCSLPPFSCLVPACLPPSL